MRIPLPLFLSYQPAVYSKYYSGTSIDIGSSGSSSGSNSAWAEIQRASAGYDVRGKRGTFLLFKLDECKFCYHHTRDSTNV